MAEPSPSYPDCFYYIDPLRFQSSKFKSNCCVSLSSVTRQGNFFIFWSHLTTIIHLPGLALQ